LFVQSLRSRKVLASVVLGVLTLAVIGVVLVTMTPVGCGPSKALGLKTLSNRCATLLAAASPTPTEFPSAKPGAPPPYSPPASAPYSPPASAPYFPPASGPIPPNGGPASGAYPPFFAPSSGPSGTDFVPALSLNCRLPVYAGPPGSGGFIVFPGGTFVADPNSSVSLPPGAPSPAPGYGFGITGLTYDRAYSKWLPVLRAWVSPDGTRYAYPSASSIYVQDVADSNNVELGSGRAWSIVAVQPEGVYASVAQTAGLWLLPYTGSPRQIATSGYWQAAAAGAAYGTPTSAVPQGASSSIIKLDLATGVISDWFGRPSSQASVSGFDAQGDPIIQVSYTTQGIEWWLTTAPSKGVPLGGSNGYYGQVAFQGTPVGDSHGVWFPANVPGAPNGGSGVVLVVPSSGIYGMSNIGGQLAGPCV
jgi:hypothetical protein